MILVINYSFYELTQTNNLENGIKTFVFVLYVHFLRVAIIYLKSQRNIITKIKFTLTNNLVLENFNRQYDCYSIFFILIASCTDPNSKIVINEQLNISSEVSNFAKS